MQSGLWIRNGAVFLAAMGVIYVILFDPFGDASHKVVVLGLMVGFSVWAFVRHFRHADEVQLTATRFGAVAGVGIGVLTAIAFVVAMRYSPAIATSIANLAAFSSNELPPAAVGFAIGSMSTVVVVLITGCAAQALWWSSRK